MTDDTVTAKLAEWEALTEGATPGPWSTFTTSWDPDARGVDVGDDGDQMLFWHAGSGIPVATAADAEFIAAARQMVPALLGFVEDVRAMIRDRHRDIGATSDYDIGHRDGWDDSLRVVELALTKRIGGAG